MFFDLARAINWCTRFTIAFTSIPIASIFSKLVSSEDKHWCYPFANRSTPFNFEKASSVSLGSTAFLLFPDHCIFWYSAEFIKSIALMVFGSTRAIRQCTRFTVAFASVAIAPILSKVVGSKDEHWCYPITIRATFFNSKKPSFVNLRSATFFLLSN